METIFGQGSFKEWAEEQKDAKVAVVAAPRFKAMAEGLGFSRVEMAMRLSGNDLDELAGSVAGHDTVAALGDGRTVMAARRAAMKAGARLVVIPTELTGSSLVTDLAGRVENGVFVEEGKLRPELAVIDPTLIWGGAEDDTRAGVGDLIGIITAVESHRALGDGFNDELGISALELVHETMDWADDIVDLTEPGIKRLFGLLDAREEFIKSLGRKYIEGPETALWMLFQHKRNFSLPLGRLKILCTVLVAGLMEAPIKPLRQFLFWVKAPWKPENLGLTDDHIAAILPEYKAFAAKYPAPASILDQMDLSGATVHKALAAVHEKLIKSSFETRED